VLNSTEAADSETSKEAPRNEYELHRVGHSQKDEQLLREGYRWQGTVGGQDFGDTAEPAGVSWHAGEALYGGDGSDHVYGLDLRLLRLHATAVNVAHPLGGVVGLPSFIKLSRSPRRMSR